MDSGFGLGVGFLNDWRHSFWFESGNRRLKIAFQNSIAEQWGSNFEPNSALHCRSTESCGVDTIERTCFFHLGLSDAILEVGLYRWHCWPQEQHSTDGRDQSNKVHEWNISVTRDSILLNKRGRCRVFLLLRSRIPSRRFEFGLYCCQFRAGEQHCAVGKEQLSKVHSCAIGRQWTRFLCVTSKIRDRREMLQLV